MKKTINDITDSTTFALRESILGTISGTGSIKSLVLIGMPGSGKSNIAERLSSLFEMNVLDTDSFIQRACNSSINLIFEERKEPYFRELESYVLNELSCFIKEEKVVVASDIDEEHKRRLTTIIESSLTARKNDELVLSTGGGMPVHNNHMTRLKSLGLVVYLVCPAEVLIKRLNDDQTRPLLKSSTNEKIEPIKEIVNKERFKRITALLSERESIYRQAHFSIDTTFQNEDEIAEQLCGRFKSWKK